MEYINDNIRLVAFALYCKETSEDIHDTFFVKQVDINALWKGYNQVMEGLEKEHFGDCTKDAITCLRCRAEWFIDDAKYIVSHWQENDETMKERNIKIKEQLKESAAMSEAIRNGTYKPASIVETTSGQTTVSVVDRQSGKTWEEIYEELKKEEK